MQDYRESGVRRRREVGGASRDRTGDLLHAMQALSQLSYGPTSIGLQAFAYRWKCGVPTGIRTPVATVKGLCPRPLDDGDLSCWWS